MIKIRDETAKLSTSYHKKTLLFFDALKRAFPFLLLFAYGVFTCSYFFLESYNSHYRLFARFVFVLGLFVFAKGIRENYKHPLFQIMSLYITYLLLSGLWDVPIDWFHLGQKLTISIYLLSFVTITYFLVHWNRALFERMLQLCILIAAAAALINLITFYRDNAFPGTRLVGIGTLTNVNEFTNVYGVFGVLAMGFALRARLLPCRLLMSLAIAIFISYAWFGQSRTAFVSIVIVLMTQAGMSLEKKRSVYMAIVTLLVFGAALAVVFPDSIEQAFLRGMGIRPQIWVETWNTAGLAPIFGHGLTSNISVVVEGALIETTHNAYLQAFWHGGVIGLSLLLLLLVVAFRQAWLLARQGGDYTVFCMLLFAACTMMTGVDTLIDRPRDQWMLFWLPLALLLSYKTLVRRDRRDLESNGVEQTEL